MSHFLPTSQTSYRGGNLFIEDVPLSDIAESAGTPCYVYSSRALEESYGRYEKAFAEISPLICYSVKANSNLAVLSLFASLGAGFDIVSGGEMERVLRAGGEMGKTVFSGVGKNTDEIKRAIERNILFFNAESVREIEEIDTVARGLGVKAPVSLRVNPDINPQTHPYISTGFKKSKFGIGMEKAEEIYGAAEKMSGVRIEGIDAHIGSQICELGAFEDSLDRILGLSARLEKKGILIRHIDIGGGLGVRYEKKDNVIPIGDFAAAVKKRMADKKHKLVLEPGRSLAANAGVLLAKVEYVKRGSGKKFIIVDAAMNDLTRPSLYGSYHEIVPARETAGGTETADIVGPVCESGDFLATDRDFPPVEKGDILAVMSAGAYCFSMASNYNTRPRAAEVMVRDGNFRMIRRRENFEDMVRAEEIADFANLKNTQGEKGIEPF